MFKIGERVVNTNFIKGIDGKATHQEYHTGTVVRVKPDKIYIVFDDFNQNDGDFEGYTFNEQELLDIVTLETFHSPLFRAMSEED